MADVKVRVIEGFNDRTDNNKYKKKNSILTVSEERAKKFKNQQIRRSLKRNNILNLELGRVATSYFYARRLKTTRRHRVNNCM
ncbi:MAG: hypothetical protein IJZ53_07565 [Tyzzerella sp.]|nr:hypothetical protein [Tyzzerella sp.]